MFINCSNHSSKFWDEKQLAEASKWGEIVDYQFPKVSALADEEEVLRLADNTVDEMLKLNPNVVMCQGEFSLTFAIVTALQKKGVKVVAACSNRKTVEKYREDGTTEKKVIFEFSRFREYKEGE